MLHTEYFHKIALLGVRHCNAGELFKELEAFGPIRRKRQRKGRLTRIYDRNFAAAESALAAGQRADYSEQIRANIDYEQLLKEYPDDVLMIGGLVQLMNEVCGTSDKTIVVDNYVLPTEDMRRKMLSLDHDCLCYVINRMKATLSHPVYRYILLRSLYNAPYNIKWGCNI